MKKALLLPLVIFISLSLHAQVNISLIPSYHIPHSGVLENYKSDIGVYLRGHSYERNLFMEIGYVKFQPAKDTVVEPADIGEYKIHYEDYSSISLNIGYIAPIVEEKRFEVLAGGYAGYWINWYDYFEQGPGSQTNGSMAVSRIQFGAILSADYILGNFKVGPELRYLGSFPLSNTYGVSTDIGGVYQGAVALGLRLSYFID